MLDITSKLILHRLNVTWAMMAESVDKFLYTDETKEMVDVVNVMLVAWVVLGLLVYLVGTFVANRLARGRPPQLVPTKPTVPQATGGTVESCVTASSQKTTATAGVTPTLNASYPVVASGSDPDAVHWTNRVIAWLLHRREHQFITDPWLLALNEKLAKANLKDGLHIELEAIHPESQRPKLHDVHVVLESKESMTITAGVTAERIVLVAKVTKDGSADAPVTRYNIHLNNLKGKVKICCISPEQLFVVRFVQRPEVKVSLHPATGESKPRSVDQHATDDILLEAVMDSLAYSVADLSFSGQKDFPNYLHKEAVSEIIQRTQLNQVSTAPTLTKHDQRLLIKVIKGSSIGGTKGSKEAYCTVEVDEPPHRYTTATVKETTNPFWDEHFLFDLSPNSTEVLFELYDKSRPTGDNFMGLGIVSIDELKRVPSQRQIISLQSRPLEYDDVSGSLTVEFLYMEGSQIPVSGDSPTTTEFSQHSPRLVEKNSRVTPAGTLITTTTIKRSPTAETKTRDLETEAILAIEEKLRILEGSPMKALDESMVEFVRSQIPEPRVSRKDSTCSDVVPPPLPSSPPPDLPVSQTSEEESNLSEGDESPLPPKEDLEQQAEQQLLNHESVEKTTVIVVMKPTAPANSDWTKDVVAEQPSDELPEERNSTADQNGNIPRDDGGSLTEAALKELEAKGRSPTATKSTLIIHSVQREDACPSLKVKMDKEGHWHEVSQLDDTSLSISPSSLRRQPNNSIPASLSCSEAEGDGKHLNGPADRGKAKKRGLLGTLRKRLSFKKNRSKSAERRADNDSLSSRSTDRAKSVPLGSARNGGSTRSSISEGSGISAASSRTFVSDKSLLVIEAKENNVLRHYLIPTSLAHRNKWRKKGAKLHIYNDHVFIAKHIQGGVQCHICGNLIARRLGKQGYVCRGCSLLCHKSCHIKAESICANSSVSKMQLEPVADPRDTRIKSS
ncbi:uncharacterized protein LOC135385591 isoform X3 [Ornithodoros turicata]|uniref:uncharacterized protein LOC135385591 isoform X3 n=1 Tax=Ornithodoros turicata TaxID=34597 RepID=UPI003138D242